MAAPSMVSQHLGTSQQTVQVDYFVPLMTDSGGLVGLGINTGNRSSLIKLTHM
jgi:hypothetical protein